jgi:hypothetical protein
MYRCQICAKVMPPRTKAYRISVETRHRRYPKREKVNRVAKDHKVRLVDDPGGEGYEIVREVTACPDCAARHKSPTG